MKPLKTIDKQALEDWDAYLKSIRKDTAVDLDMPYEERQKRLIWRNIRCSGSRRCFRTMPNMNLPPSIKRP